MDGRFTPSLDFSLVDSSEKLGLQKISRANKIGIHHDTHVADLRGLRTSTLGSLTISCNNMRSILDHTGDTVYLFLLGVRHIEYTYHRA